MLLWFILLTRVHSIVQNPASDEPAEESRLLSLLANVLEGMVDATEQREQARLQARLQVHSADEQYCTSAHV